MSDFERIEKAMAYMVKQAPYQPTLEQVAAHVHLSPYHFQRVFCRWAGTTPKRFLQALTLERGKRLLGESCSLLEVTQSIGLSSGSRLYDHFVQLEAATPGEFKSRGQGMTIEYGLHQTPFGRMLVAVTRRGVCRMEFVDYAGADEALAGLREGWPLSAFKRSGRSTRHVVDRIFDGSPGARTGPLSLHVKGTNFQVAVWRALLRIPFGRVVTYSQIAGAVGSPRAARAVGSAIGANPVALLIPCHRVIQQSGALGDFRWGAAKKRMIQTWEQLHQETIPPLPTRCPTEPADE